MKYRAICRRGFTLIELLVVIAIIALLVSILVPSLAKAKRIAKNVQCTGNLHSWGNAYYMYSNDYSGWVLGSWANNGCPPAITVTTDSYGDVSLARLNPYLPGVRMPDPNSYQTWSITGPYCCPMVMPPSDTFAIWPRLFPGNNEVAPPGNSGGPFIMFDYAVLSGSNRWNWKPGGVTAGNQNDLGTNEFSGTQLLMLDNVLWYSGGQPIFNHATDKSPNDGYAVYWDAGAGSGARCPTSSATSVTTVEGANELWGDGHAEFVDRSTMKLDSLSASNLTATNRWVYYGGLYTYY